ncbi:Lrp/AsnC family transcriptional regulator [uncultured Reyranella sp.]|uniref:Lrp/AsnC family transcriptional regulator n=1 Tax=uncultured Reyranella sp. TaxID=735512 RepID=UPI00259CEC4B|nr:Lrp/AsnC family transcriptional regulator [uncultured Reyranella sp.]
MGTRKGDGLDDTDRALLRLLAANSREPATVLARKLSLARATVQDRIDRLKRRGVISKFTVEVNATAKAAQVTACIFIKANLKNRDAVARAIARIRGIRELYKMVGENDDFLAIVDGDGTAALDTTIGEIIAVSGVERTTSKLMLAKVR